MTRRGDRVPRPAAQPNGTCTQSTNEVASKILGAPETMWAQRGVYVDGERKRTSTIDSGKADETRSRMAGAVRASGSR